MRIPFTRWLAAAPDVDAGARSISLPWVSGAPFAAPAAVPPPPILSTWPPDRWVSGAPLLNPLSSTSWARWVTLAPMVCPSGAAAPPPPADLLLTITCIDAVSTTDTVRPGVNGRWCPDCFRLWVAVVSPAATAVRLYEGTSSDATDALPVAAPTAVSAASATPGWAPSISASSDRYVAGYPVHRVL